MLNEHLTGVGLDNWQGDFPTTRWTLLSADEESSQSSATTRALAELSGRYWYPLYAYLRKRGHPDPDAQDLTQGFFAELLSGNGLAGVDHEKGRFRSYLLGALNHYVLKVYARGSAQKRGGGKAIISIDQDCEKRFQSELIDGESPEKAYDRHWAVSVIQQVLARLEHDYAKKSKRAVFDSLKLYLTGDAERGSYQEAAASLETTEVNVRTMVKRLRKRFRELLNEYVSSLVSSADDTEDEIKFLFQSLV